MDGELAVVISSIAVACKQVTAAFASAAACCEAGFPVTPRSRGRDGNKFDLDLGDSPKPRLWLVD